MRRERIAGLGLLLVALALLLVALPSAWWSYGLRIETTLLGVTTTSTVDLEYHLTEVRTRGEVLGNPFADASSYEERGNPDLEAVFGNTLLLLWIALGLVLMALAGVLLAVVNRVPPAAAGSLGLVAALAILGTVGYFAVALPPAVESSSPDLPGGLDPLAPTGFWGRDASTVPTTTLSGAWGPASGWYEAVAALGAAVLATALLLRRSA